MRFTLTLWTALCLSSCATTPPTDSGADVDQDGDGILDAHEGDADPDGDGVPALRDRDSDGDDLDDAIEAGDDVLLSYPVDADSDGVPDFLDLDSDGNGLPDTVEAFGPGQRVLDSDGDGVIDSSDLDDDNDTIPDVEEMSARGDRDSDRDGLPDRLDPDSDDDGLADADEAWCSQGRLCDTDNDGLPDVLDLDSDNDGLSDQDESGAPDRGVARPPRDTDADGVYDARDLDADGDGLADAHEVGVVGTSPTAWDSDADGLTDGLEVQLGLDPLDAASTWTGPIVLAKPRFEGELSTSVTLNRARLDVVLEPGSNLFFRFAPALLKALVAVAPETLDLGVAVATVSGYGSFDGGGCREEPLKCGWEPHELHRITSPQVAVAGLQVLTTDIDRVIDLVSKDTRAYPDWPWWMYGGTLDALALPEYLMQLATGRGYDLHCDGKFDVDLDLAPWPRGPDDLFAGSSNDPVYMGNRIGPVGTMGLREGSHRLLMMRPTVSEDLTVDGMLVLNPGAKYDPTGIPGLERFYEPLQGMCPEAATVATAVDALRAAHFSVVVAPEARCDTTDLGACYPPDTLRQSVVMQQVARDLGAVWDPDGDGIDGPMQLGSHTELAAISQTDSDEATKVAFFTERLGPILEHLIGTQLDPSRATILIVDDTMGLVVSVTPDTFDDPDLGDTLAVTLRWRGAQPPTEGDQGSIVTLRALGDGFQHLGETRVLFIVPGTGRVD